MKPFIAIVLLSACSEYKFVSKTDAMKGGDPAIEVSPDFVDFGLTTLDSVLPGEIVTITNVGEAPLDVFSATLADATAPFGVTTMPESTLGITESIDLVVDYAPIEIGTDRAQIIITSSDPARPEVAIELEGQVSGEPDIGTPDLVTNPTLHDFGIVSIDSVVTTSVELKNIGDAPLRVTALDLASASTEFVVDTQESTNGPLPWSIPADDIRNINVHYAPIDGTVDHGDIIIVSNDPDEPEAIVELQGSSRTFEGFSTGWFIYDDGLDHETTSSGDYVIDHHGDSDLYWYEPSGAHGLVDSPDPVADFAMMRDFVMVGAGAPSVVTGPMTFSSSSSLATFAFATFTYVMCDFWIEPGEDPARYEVSASAVDDGIQVMVNSQIMGRMNLGAAPTRWSLADIGVPGSVNTLIVILVDDSASMRYLNELAFYKDGVMVE
jgi:hypothetical protein